MSGPAPRSIGAIQADIEEQDRIYTAAMERLGQLRKELAEALFAAGVAKGHPWLGKAVEREKPRGYRGATQTIRGVVALYDPEIHRRSRGVSYGLKPGEAFVLSRSGKTSYRLKDYDWGAKVHICRWKLSGEQSS